MERSGETVKFRSSNKKNLKTLFIEQTIVNSQGNKNKIKPKTYFPKQFNYNKITLKIMSFYFTMAFHNCNLQELPIVY